MFMFLDVPEENNLQNFVWALCLNSASQTRKYLLILINWRHLNWELSSSVNSANNSHFNIGFFFNVQRFFFFYCLSILWTLREETRKSVHSNWASQLFFTCFRLYAGFVTILWLLKRKVYSKLLSAAFTLYLQSLKVLFACGCCWGMLQNTFCQEGFAIDSNCFVDVKINWRLFKRFSVLMCCFWQNWKIHWPVMLFMSWQ